MQITIWNRLNKHEHRTLINDFCNQIKSRFINTRKNRRQHDILTLNKCKQQWYKKFQKKLFLKNKTKNTQRTKIYKKIFNNKWKQIWIAYQMKHSRNLCLTLTNDIKIKRLKLHKKLIKFENSLTTQIRTKRINLIDYLFNKRMSKIVSFACFCDWIKQNIKHIVLQCFDYTQNKNNMFKKKYDEFSTIHDHR